MSSGALMIVVLIVFILVMTFVSMYRPVLFLGDLTGYTYYQKRHNGNVLMVQYMQNGRKEYRQATRKDIKILRRYRYIP